MTPIMFSFEDPQKSLSKVACTGITTSLTGKGIDEFNKLSDNEVAKITSEEIKNTYGLNEAGVKGVGEDIRKNLEEYFKVLKKAHPDMNLDSAESSVLSACEAVYGGNGKKNTIAQNQKM